jgi:arabinofuranosyltransferase
MSLKSFFLSYRNLHKTDRLWAIVLGLILITVASIYFLNAYRVNPTGNFSTYADDTYIHLRFAHHLASGQGIVWNIGDQPVEGSTSFLYMLMMVIIEKIGIQPIWTLAYICAFFAVLSLLFTLILLETINKDHLLENLIVVIMLGLSPRLMLWALTGLEVTLYAFALVACALAYILYRVKKMSPWIVGIIFAVTTLIRPECLAIFGMTIAFEALTQYLSGERKYHLIFHLLGSFLIIYLPIFLWKWSYFGYPFPNTYYDKTGGGLIQITAGVSYLWTNLVETFFPSGLLGISFLITMKKDEYSREKIYLLILLLASWLIVAFNGGDYMLKGRFLTPMLPILYTLGAMGVSQLSNRIPRNYSLTLISGLLLIACITWYVEKPIIKNYGDKPFPSARLNKPREIVSTPEFVAMGRALRDIAKPGDSIALVPVGAVAYYSEMIVYDMVGLVDPVIAHEPFDLKYIESSWRPGHDKGDGLYIIQHKPTYILLVDRLTNEPLPGVDDWAMQYKSIVEIWDSPLFHEQYEFCPFKITGGWIMNLYCRKNSIP